MHLTITTGLKELIDHYCQSVPPRLFWYIEHRGALLAVAYGEGYISNFTIPSSLFEKTLTPTNPEQQYLLDNPDLVLIPFFQGKTTAFRERDTFYVEQMGHNYPYFPLILLIQDTDYKLYDTKIKEKAPFVIVDHLPPHMADKVKQFLGFLKK